MICHIWEQIIYSCNTLECGLSKLLIFQVGYRPEVITKFFQASYGNTLHLLYSALGKLEGGLLILGFIYNLH